MVYLSIRDMIRSATLGICMLMVCSVTHAWGGVRSHGVFQDPAFADPDDTSEMPQEWLSKPIVHNYDESFDLFAILSFQLFDIWEPWIKQFAEKKGVQVHVHNGDDGTSAGHLRRKDADIACFCGSPNKTDRLPGVEFHTIGVVPVVFYVNIDSHIDKLSLNEAMKIFHGEIVNWVELGGDELNIVPVARNHCKKRRGRWRPLNNMDELSPATITVGAIEDALEYVAATPGSISYEILTRIDPYVKQGRVRVLDLEGMNPYDLNFLSKGLYPLYRAYTFTTWSGENTRNPTAEEVVKMLVKSTEDKAGEIFFVSATELRKSGWKFRGDELVGEPGE